jgi:hypothetical protein
MNLALTLAIILFTVVFGTFFTILYIWWRKYGKKLYNMFNSYANKSGMYGKTPILPSKEELKRQINQIQQLIRQNQGKNQ